MAVPMACLSIALLSKTQASFFLPCRFLREIKLFPTGDCGHFKWLPVFIGVFSISDARILTHGIPWSSCVSVPVHPTDCSCPALLKPVAGWCQVKVGQLTWSPSLVSLQQGYWRTFGHWRALDLFNKIFHIFSFYERMILKITSVVGQKEGLNSCRSLMPYPDTWA